VSQGVGKPWTVYRVPNPNFNKPSRPPHLDTVAWFNAMTENTDYYKLSGDFSIGKIDFTADQHGQITTGADRLTTPKWNEIGESRFPTSHQKN